MKSRLALIALCTLAVIGCNNKEKEEELQKQLSTIQSEHATLQQDLADRDKYFEEVMHTVNEVYTDLERARVKEGKLSERAGGGEMPAQITDASSRQKLLQNIGDIGSALKENRKKIARLETQAKSFKGEIAGLNKLIDNLKQSLKEREESIAQLEGKVQGLETTVSEKTKVITEKEAQIDDQQKKLSTAYFIVGTRKELKQKGVITDEGGFLWGLLGSTTVMASGVDPTLFTSIDKSKEQAISVQGKIDEILPHRNEEFFATAQPVENNSVLSIVRPEGFWQDNYLVIVLD